MKKGFCLVVFVSALALVLATSQTTSPSAPTNPGPPKPPNPVGSEQTPSAAPQTRTSTQGTAAGEDPQTQIQRALTSDPAVGHDNIMVSVSGNDIDLTGDVTSEKEKDTANKIANKYAGSLRVKNHLKVHGAQPDTPSSATTPHEKLVSYSNKADPVEQNSTGTPGGTTSGTAKPQTAAPGNNTPEVPTTEQTPPSEAAVDASQLQLQIQNALKNEPTLANDNVNVTVSDDEINLSGNVATAKQKLTAKRIVQSYAGNRKVKDHLALAGHNPQ